MARRGARRRAAGGRGPSVKDAECVELLRWALPRLGLRWEGFRRVRRQVCRRIARRIAEVGAGDAAGYRALLEASPGEWEALDALCRVTISRFFRDREVWAALRDEVLPAEAREASLRGEGTLRCWSAGCASGEEPYGLAIVFRLAVAPAFPDLGLRVVATDLDGAVLARARRARYADATLRDLPAEWREAAFERRAGELCLREQFREGVEFLHQDLRREMPDGPFRVVLCRNLAFTYFDLAGQRAVLAGIAARLAPGGCLVVGAHESLPEPAGRFRRWNGRRALFRLEG